MAALWQPGQWASSSPDHLSLDAVSPAVITEDERVARDKGALSLRLSYDGEHHAWRQSTLRLRARAVIMDLRRGKDRISAIAGNQLSIQPPWRHRLIGITQEAIFAVRAAARALTAITVTSGAESGHY